MNLAGLGWSDFFAQAFTPHAAQGRTPARIGLEHKHAYLALGEAGEIQAELAGRLLNDFTRADLPAVGDWVALEPGADPRRARIHAVLPRRTRFSRRAAGAREEEQVVAANIDTAFLVSGFDADFNPRRMERYLALAQGSGAEPVLVLNKADVCPESAALTAQVIAIAGGAPVHAISAVTGEGVDALERYFQVGRTIALLGSSGVGKSTLVNRLLGHARQSVGPVRETDGRGKHTTTRRELIPIAGGALLIDTPGMRELQLWDSARDGLMSVFPEVMELAASCRFRDCRHETEPGCAVRAAVAAAQLPPERFASFLKLRAELETLERAGKIGGGAKSDSPRVKVKGRRIMRR